MLHAYSLVHDDLPAMDDDDLRRGKPRTHKAFDEATAILAGDALQTRAFEVLAEPDTHSDPQARCELVAALGAAAGARGMAGGQMIDMLAEGQTLDGRGDAAAGAEDRAADPVQRRGRRHPGPRAAAAARICWRPMAATSAPPSRSPTTCWTPRAAPRRSARPPARTRPPARRRMVAVLGSSGRARRPRCWPRQAADHLDGFGDRAACGARCSRARRRYVVDSGGVERNEEQSMSPVEHAAAGPGSDPGRPAQLLARAAAPAGRRAARGDDRRGLGHRRPLGAALGVVELTVALHAVFDTPRDRLIWDVGHQAYPHKILTGRRDRIRTLRQGGGLSGFTRRAESEYDPFGAAHSSTSISAGLGMAVARDLKAAQRQARRSQRDRA